MSSDCNFLKLASICFCHHQVSGMWTLIISVLFVCFETFVKINLSLVPVKMNMLISQCHNVFDYKDKVYHTCVHVSHSLIGNLKCVY